jgi:hypothetical protein
MPGSGDQAGHEQAAVMRQFQRRDLGTQLHPVPGAGRIPGLEHNPVLAAGALQPQQPRISALPQPRSLRDPRAGRRGLPRPRQHLISRVPHQLSVMP